jgi:uncharacterized protein (TIGR04255 family)
MTNMSIPVGPTEPRRDDEAGPLLSKPPLQEAIFEVRWALMPDSQTALAGDPHFKIAHARFFDKVSAVYPKYEALEPASLPDTLAKGNAQYRWQSDRSPGLLVQLGPGLMTVNHVQPTMYRWELFRNACSWALKTLASVYPGDAGMKPDSIMFRYLNSVPFDSDTTEIHEFLQNKLHIGFAPIVSILPVDRVAPKPFHVHAQSSFVCDEPTGRVTVAVAQVHAPQERLLWQIVFDSRTPDIPEIRDGALQWLSSAHSVVDAIFRKMIRGDLEREFA